MYKEENNVPLFFVVFFCFFQEPTAIPSRKKRRWVCQEVEFAVGQL